MILKEPEPDPNPTLFTTFYFSRGIKASISYHKIDVIIDKYLIYTYIQYALTCCCFHVLIDVSRNEAVY